MDVMQTSAPEGPVQLYDLTRQELGSLLGAWGAPRYAGKQVFQWLYRRRVSSFDAMTDLSADFRALLHEKAALPRPALVARQDSIDGTSKFLWESRGLRYESVLIPMARDEEGEPGRHTACLSTQAGCRMKCAFCATGVPRFAGDLTPGEIVLQMMGMEEVTGIRFASVVVMGMGEPLDNYEASERAMRILHDPEGLDYGRRRITLSTCGMPDPLKRFIKDDWPVSLALSLHSADPEVRGRLMPATRSVPLERLRKLLREYTFVRRLPVTLEYVLLRGVNDRTEDAERMAAFCKGLLCKVNLIRYNPVFRLPYGSPTEDEVLAFQKLLKSKGVKTFLRERKGADITAACGQLGGTPEPETS
jgi:23S rRNA (adenine2503-C2)-methyltransferase